MCRGECWRILQTYVIYEMKTSWLSVGVRLQIERLSSLKSFFHWHSSLILDDQIFVTLVLEGRAHLLLYLYHFDSPQAYIYTIHDLYLPSGTDWHKESRYYHSYYRSSLLFPLPLCETARPLSDLINCVDFISPEGFASCDITLAR